MRNFDRDDMRNDMSMEDILASIRKYVTDTDNSASRAKEESPPQDTNSGNLDHSENIINLEKSQIADEEENKEEPSEEVIHTEPSLTFISNPFGKLADALKSCGKPKEQNKNPEPLTIDKFLEGVAASVIEKWADENLEQIVERIVEREIERIKGESGS